jgi:membrane fusion protein, multidrug efflux system
VQRRLAPFAIVVVVAVIGVAAWQWRHSTPSRAQSGPAAIPVIAGSAVAKDIPVYVQAIGTVQAFNTVNVRTRVDGQVTEVAFREGQEVRQGDPLFQIDKRPFEAALSQAQATKAKDEAQLHGATLDLERYGQLLPKGFQTRQSYDQQTATVGQLQAAVKADQALIDSAQLNLDYALIRAPISGRTGQRNIDTGNFVQAGQGTNLVTITQLKPIFVSLTVPQESLDDIRQNQAKSPLAVQAYSGDDKTLLSQGSLTLIDNQVDVATGTVHLKATFDNSDERLWPGEFVSAHLIVSTRTNAITVPSQAVLQGANGAYVYVIKPDDTAERRSVDVALTQRGVAVLDKGVSVGERVVVEGQHRLTDGAKLKIDTSQQAALGQEQQRQ